MMDWKIKLLLLAFFLAFSSFLVLIFTNLRLLKCSEREKKKTGKKNTALSPISIFFVFFN